MLFISIDGGGTKGCFMFHCLQLIQSIVLHFEPRQFGGIVGVSSGSMVAGLFATGKLANMTSQCMCELISKVVAPTRGLFTDRSTHVHTKLELLQRVFGTLTLGDCIYPLHIVTCTTAGEPYVWSSTNPQHRGKLLATLIDASSAIPLIFTHTIIDTVPHMDGGICTGSPTLLTFLLARTRGVCERDIRILSLGIPLYIHNQYSSPKNLLECFSQRNIRSLVSSSDRLFNSLLESILGTHQLVRIESTAYGDSDPMDTSIMEGLRIHAIERVLGYHFCQLCTFLYPFMQKKIRYFS